MIVQTEAFLLGAQNIHSSKSNRDFVKISAMIEGSFCTFFVSKADGDQMKQAKQFAGLQKSGEPQKCVFTLEIEFTDRGTFVNVRAIQ